MTPVSWPRRFRLAFGLRTFLLAIAMICVWLGWNAAIVRQRAALRYQIRRSGGYVVLDRKVLGPLDECGRELMGSEAFDIGGGNAQIPLVRRLMGDEEVWLIRVTSEAQRDKIARLFPESSVTIGAFDWGTAVPIPNWLKALTQAP